MLANRSALGDFKENAMSLAPGKTIPRGSQKGLRYQRNKCFSDSTNLIPTKKPASELKFGSRNSVSEEKENSIPKFKEPAVKSKYHDHEEVWPEIEKMHIYVEPEDDYEDILPKHERIQKKDLDSLFFNYSDLNFTELPMDKPLSPLKEIENEYLPELLRSPLKSLDIDIYIPDIPDISASLIDDTELDYVALPDDFLI